jgi:hypothetical protein
MFLISPISSYCNDLMKTLSAERVLMQQVSEHQAPDPRTVLIYFLSILQNRLCDILLTYCCFKSRRYSVVSPNMFVFGTIYLCEVVFTHEMKKDLRNIRMNRYQFVTSNESRKNTNVKSETNRLNTNKRCQFLENIVPMKKTSEQNPIGYCNVDFLFKLGSNNCFLYLWHRGTF